MIFFHIMVSDEIYKQSFIFFVWSNLPKYWTDFDKLFINKSVFFPVVPVDYK